MKCLALTLATGLVLLGITAIPGGESAAQVWAPDEHPATLSRTISGFTRPVAAITIAAEDQARLLSLEVAEGQRLSGDNDQDMVTVARLDRRLPRLKRDHLAAALAQAEAAAKQAEAGLASAQIEATWWQSEAARVSDLAADGRAPKRDATEMRFRADTAQAQVELQQAAVAGAHTQIQAAQSQLASQELILERHHLHAPSGWIVAERLAEPGSLLLPGTPVLIVVDCRQMEVPLRVSEAELQALRAMPNIALVSVLDQQQIAAELHSVDPRFDPQSRKYLVRLRLDGQQWAKLPGHGSGREVAVTMQLPDPAGGLRIPLAWAERRLEQWWVTDTEGQRLVITPLRREGEFLIVAGDQLPHGITLRQPK